MKKKIVKKKTTKKIVKKEKTEEELYSDEITRSEGGQPGNKNAEKWTEEDALEVGRKLKAWLKAHDDNIFYKEFLYLHNDYTKDNIDYWKKKYKSFYAVMENIKAIQQVKLLKGGTAGSLQPSITKFALAAIHGLVEQTSVDHTSKGKSINNITIKPPSLD